MSLVTQATQTEVCATRYSRLLTYRAVELPTRNKVARQGLLDDTRPDHFNRNPILLQQRIVVLTVCHLA